MREQTMKKQTLEMHRLHIQRSQQLVREIYEKEGHLWNVHSMGTVNGADHPLFSFTMEIPDGGISQSIRDAGFLLGATPDGQSVTIMLTVEVQEDMPNPDLHGADVLMFVTVGMESLGRTAVTEAVGTMIRVDDSGDDLVLTPVEEEVTVLDGAGVLLENAAAEARAKWDALDLDEYIPLAALVAEKMHDDWVFMPLREWQMKVIRRLIEEYTPEGFVEAREVHAGVRALTPDVQVMRTNPRMN